MKCINEKYYEKEEVLFQMFPTYELKINMALVNTPETIITDIEKTIETLLNNKNIVAVRPIELNYLGFSEIITDEVSLKKKETKF